MWHKHAYMHTKHARTRAHAAHRLGARGRPSDSGVVIAKVIVIVIVIAIVIAIAERLLGGVGGVGDDFRSKIQSEDVRWEGIASSWN